MKAHLLLLVGSLLCSHEELPQGLFYFANPGAPTRLYSPDGELAGPHIWAQMLVGEIQDDLFAVGSPVRHMPLPPGMFNGGFVSVEQYPPGMDVFVQMVAWDGALWGSALENVPEHQLGRTDIVPLRLDIQIPPTPFFNQSAIVPIPEPSGVMLLGCGIIAWCLRASLDRFTDRPREQ